MTDIRTEIHNTITLYHLPADPEGVHLVIRVDNVTHAHEAWFIDKDGEYMRIQAEADPYGNYFATLRHEQE